MDEKERYRYWESGDGYNRYITAELASFRKEAWKKQVTGHFNGRKGLNILDVGTGPGFFACILSEEGHHLTGIDYSAGMIKTAKENAGLLGVSPRLIQMDVNHLTFEDDTFDVIVTRNVTWTLEHPKEVYKELIRILRPGGMLLIYDANWHMHLFDEEKGKKVKAREEAYFNKYGRVEIVATEDREFLATAPLTRTDRPAWDIKMFEEMGIPCTVTEDIGRFVYEEWEKELYAESPLFEICAVKPEQASYTHVDTTQKDYRGDILTGLQSYWDERSESYSEQNVEEMENWKKEAWRKLILDNAPENSHLKVLDIGTGPGFFAMNLAQAGCEVSAVDVTPDMLAHAKANAAHYQVSVDFHLFDGKKLPFDSDSFDLVVSRNVLWNVEYPEEALREWKRVLRPGGRMVYFDAVWYLYLFDEEQKKKHDAAHKLQHDLFPDIPHDPMGKEKALFLENLARRLPLSREKRPAWDIRALENLGMKIIKADPDVTGYVYDDYEKIHNSASPLFMICAEK